jgi:hypothetical protein
MISTSRREGRARGIFVSPSLPWENSALPTSTNYLLSGRPLRAA